MKIYYKNGKISSHADKCQKCMRVPNNPKCPVCNNDCQKYYYKGEFNRHYLTCGSITCKKKLMVDAALGNKKCLGRQNNLGYRHTIEAKLMIGKASKGNKYAVGTIGRRGQKHSLESIKKMCATHRANVDSGRSHFIGAKNPNYVDGKSRERMSQRNKEMISTAYTIWRRSVFIRDNYTCQHCGKRGGQLNADHIKMWALYPNLRYEVANGRTLCVECHKKTDTYGSKGLKKQMISDLNVMGCLANN